MQKLENNLHLVLPTAAAAEADDAPDAFLMLLFGCFPLATRQSSQSHTFGRFSGGGSRQE